MNIDNREIAKKVLGIMKQECNITNDADILECINKAIMMIDNRKTVEESITCLSIGEKSRFDTEYKKLAEAIIKRNKD